MTTPQAGRYHPATEISTIAGFLADPVDAASFPAHILRFRNDRAAVLVGLETLSNAAWIDHFGRFVPLPGSLQGPLALRYHGHQFRHYNPDIGDGRGFLFAQLRDEAGRLLDLGTKGSGTTPYSRFGDSRLTLKGGVREVLATEMLEALGVNTSKSFSLIETCEALNRGDEPSPTRSSALVRLSHGHIRIGSFQRLAAIGDADAMTRLTNYCLRALYNLNPDENNACQLLDFVVNKTADLAASYMVAGFVHGVLNSDNIAITGESFDYGPWRFTQQWDKDFVAAYFDHNGLYAFGRQAEAIHWNVWQLANSLTLICDNQSLETSLNRFAAAYQAALTKRFFWRLGLVGVAIDDATAGWDSAIAGLQADGVTIDQFFHDWRSGDCATERLAAYDAPQWADWRSWIAKHAAPAHDAHPYWRDSQPCSMPIAEVEEIWDAIATQDDWTLFHIKIKAIRRMGAAHAIDGTG